MDADDELAKNDKDKVRKLLKNDEADAYFFETLSYIGDRPGIDVVKNINVRFIKNHRGYMFEGAIHEQIVSDIIKKNKNARILPKKLKYIIMVT